MIKKEIEILEKTKKFIFSIKYELNSNHLAALLLIRSNAGIEFTQRSSKNQNDIHGLEVTWMVCDEMVDIGLLMEDDESYNVRYVITALGLEIMNKMK